MASSFFASCAGLSMAALDHLSSLLSSLGFSNDSFLLKVGLTLFLSLSLAYYLFGIIHQRHGKLPPEIPAFPFFGGLLKFTKGPHALITEYYPKLGSVFSVKLLHRRMIFLIGPEVNPHFFKANESQLSQKEVYQFNVPTFGPGVVFDVPYSIRMEQFRFFADSLKITRLRTYVDTMIKEAQDYFSTWGDEGVVDLKEEMSSLIILTASHCLLGPEVREKMFNRVSHLFHELDAGMIPISVVAPYLPIGPHRRRDKARKELSQIFSQIIRERKASGNKAQDMLQVFIDSKYKADGRSTTEEECTGLLIAALFAGQHTSSLTATWTGAYMMRYSKEYLPAVITEQQNVMQKHGGHLDYDVLNTMDNLHWFIKEALRLHPPLVMLLRYVNEAYSVVSKEGVEYEIPKGSIVATSPSYANRLPHIFSNPDSFDPLRYAPGREEDKALPFSYISFGGGRHGCMGENFAYMQVKCIWSILLRNFEFELISPFPEIDWTSSLVVGPKGKVMVKFKRRKLQI